ncbi:hypothetical protein DFJ74DRAFT_100494 [Hyaloraphidium curvatum]|nr:hypothetical protein DFJ74DRAFT_100494 [Hyaloraphidium curvatum]
MASPQRVARKPATPDVWQTTSAAAAQELAAGPTKPTVPATLSPPSSGRSTRSLVAPASDHGAYRSRPVGTLPKSESTVFAKPQPLPLPPLQTSLNHTERAALPPAVPSPVGGPASLGYTPRKRPVQSSRGGLEPAVSPSESVSTSADDGLITTPAPTTARYNADEPQPDWGSKSAVSPSSFEADLRALAKSMPLEQTSDYGSGQRFGKLDYSIGKPASPGKEAVGVPSPQQERRDAPAPLLPRREQVHAAAGTLLRTPEAEISNPHGPFVPNYVNKWDRKVEPLSAPPPPVRLAPSSPTRMPVQPVPAVPQTPPDANSKEFAQLEAAHRRLLDENQFLERTAKEYKDMLAEKSNDLTNALETAKSSMAAAAAIVSEANAKLVDATLPPLPAQAHQGAQESGFGDAHDSLAKFKRLMDAKSSVMNLNLERFEADYKDAVERDRFRLASLRRMCAALSKSTVGSDGQIQAPEEWTRLELAPQQAVEVDDRAKQPLEFTVHASTEVVPSVMPHVVASAFREPARSVVKRIEVGGKGKVLGSAVAASEPFKASANQDGSKGLTSSHGETPEMPSAPAELEREKSQGLLSELLAELNFG